jgi:hypothetical protein
MPGAERVLRAGQMEWLEEREADGYFLSFCFTCIVYALYCSP